jgi:hypothetical protein
MGLLEFMLTMLKVGQTSVVAWTKSLNAKNAEILTSDAV